MPRNNDVYSPPPGTGGTPQTPINSAMFNAYVADITADLNAARPIVAGGTGETTARLKDTWYFYDPSDDTKRVRLDAGGVTAGQTRVLTVPNANTTLVGTDTAQTLTNKTFPSLTVSGATPTITFTYTGGPSGFIGVQEASGTLILSADGSNTAADTKIVLRTDGTTRAEISSTGFSTSLSGTFGTGTFGASANSTSMISLLPNGYTGTIGADGTGISLTTNSGSRGVYGANSNGTLFDFQSGVATIPAAATTTANAANCYVTSTGILLRSTSAIKYKQDVEPLEMEYAERILDFEPVWYRSKCAVDPSEWSYYGFIAEAVAEIDPRYVHFGGENRDVPEGIGYDRLVVPIIALLKQQKAKIEELEARLSALEGGVSG